MTCAVSEPAPARGWRHGLLGAVRLAGLALLALVTSAQAQTLDDIDVRSQLDAKVVRIRFNASVSFVQLVPAGAADLYSLRFEVLSADESVLRQTNEEFRRVPAADGLPEMTLSYSPDSSNRVKQITVRLSQALPVEGRQGPNARSIELLVRNAVAPAPQQGAAPLGRYVLKLQTLRLDEREQSAPIPKEFNELEVITSDTVIEGVPSYEVTVGYFATMKEAEAALAIALPRFPRAQIVERLAVATAPPPPIDTAAAGVQGQAGAAAPETEAEAATLMAKAREELSAKHADAAVAALNQLLKLPPNAQSQAAQELIGNAWELADNAARARAEYDLYLKLYPQGDGANRVGQRLAALGVVVPRPGETAVAQNKPEPPKTWSGNLAQYYYGGKAKTKSLVTLETGGFNSTLSRTTESSIVTSLDLSGRLAGTNSETRAVVRGSGSTSLLSAGHSSSSIGAVYVEHRRTGETLNGLAIRAGRQSPISGGLLGLFDGVSLAYPVRDGLKIDVMGGTPASALISSPSERLFATVVEADTLAERWGGNFYLLDQTTQGITNRRALGAELRYAGDQWSLNTLLDYDSVFAKLNAVSVHGSFQAGQQTTVTLLADQRRAPSLQLTNALISSAGSGADSLKSLLAQPGQSLDSVREQALNTSAIATQILASVSRPLSARWQASMDLRYSAVGALPAVQDFQATEATGGQYSWSAQLTGTNLYSKRDINNFNVSVTTTPFFKGVQLAYNNLTGMPDIEDLTLEPSVRFYYQTSSDDTKLTRLGPGVRSTYRASRRSSLLGELLFETSRSSGKNSNTSNSVFFYVGYRYELF